MEMYRGNSVTVFANKSLVATEETLVARARLGDEAAFTELYRKHAPMASRVIQRITKNQDDTEDVIQDTFTRAYIHLCRFDGRSRFSTWVTRIAVNCALMLYRKRKRLSECSLDAPPDGERVPMLEVPDKRLSPEHLCILKNEVAELTRAVGRLPPTLRVVMNSRLRKDIPVQEIADNVGLSLPATKSRLMRATRRLKSNMLTKRNSIRHSAH